MDNANQPPQRHFLLQEAIQLLREKRHKEAAQTLAQYLRINPKSEEAWFLYSFTIQDPAKKIYCLERVLELNPDNIKARDRLETIKISAVLPIGGISQNEKPKRLVWVFFAAGSMLAIILVVIGFWGFRQLFLTSSPTEIPLQIAKLSPSPAQSQIALLIATDTPIAPTASTTPTVTVTPTPSPTIYIQPTSIIIDEYTASQMDDIQIQVEQLRKLPAISSVQRNFVSKEQVRAVLESIYLERSSRDKIGDQVRVLSTLGLIEPTYDLYSKTLDQIGEGIGGFYIPWTDNLYVIGTDFDGVEKYVYAHEYTHALVDQHYSLESIGVYPECLSDADYCLAISALIEGDATYLMTQWLENFGSEADINDIISAQYAPLDRTISSSDLAPPYVIRELEFRYGDGVAFVDYLYQIGRWQIIDLAYDNPPKTTEQILHPEKFQIRETAIPQEIPDLQGVLGNQWRFLGSDTLGELGTEMVLGYSAHRLAQLDPTIAAEAAKGWGGDNYQVYFRSSTNSSVLAVHWVWDKGLEWEREVEADQFWAAMWDHLDHRYRGDNVDTEYGDCWQLLNDHFSCIFRSELETLWLSSPDLATMDAIRDLYPSFRQSE